MTPSFTVMLRHGLVDWLTHCIWSTKLFCIGFG